MSLRRSRTPRSKFRPWSNGQRSWIVTDELNKFIWPGYDLRPVSRDKPAAFAWGFLPQELFDTLKQSVVAHQRARRLKFVERA